MQPLEKLKSKMEATVLKKKKTKKIETDFEKNLNKIVEYSNIYYEKCLEHSTEVTISAGRVFYRLAKLMHTFLYGKELSYKKDKRWQQYYFKMITLIQRSLVLYKQIYLHPSHLYYKKANELYRDILKKQGFNSNIYLNKLLPGPKTQKILIEQERKLSEKRINNPEDKDVLIQYAKILIALGKTDEAIETYSTLVLNKSDIDSYLHRAHLYHSQKKYDEAIRGAVSILVKTSHLYLEKN